MDIFVCRYKVSQLLAGLKGALCRPLKNPLPFDSCHSSMSRTPRQRDAILRSLSYASQGPWILYQLPLSWTKTYLVAMSMHTIVAPYAVLLDNYSTLDGATKCRTDMSLQVCFFTSNGNRYKNLHGPTQTLQESDLRIAATRKGTDGSQNCAMCRKNLLGTPVWVYKET